VPQLDVTPREASTKICPQAIKGAHERGILWQNNVPAMTVPCFVIVRVGGRREGPHREAGSEEGSSGGIVLTGLVNRLPVLSRHAVVVLPALKLGIKLVLVLGA
jgi:hypothetical protein